MIADESNLSSDKSFHLLVDSEAIPPASSDPQLIQSRERFREDCQSRFELRSDAEKGTSVCPAWEKATNEIDNLPTGTRPLVFTQVHSNESEAFCESILGALSSSVEGSNGFHFIIDSSNEGSRFNEDLRSYIVNNSSTAKLRTRFIESLRTETCVEEVVNFVRYSEPSEEPNIQC